LLGFLFLTLLRCKIGIKLLDIIFMVLFIVILILYWVAMLIKLWGDVIRLIVGVVHLLEMF
jgi:hypothetical protein